MISQGCASDIGTHWYCLSSDVDPDWDRSHVAQPNLAKYWRGLTDKYGVDKHLQFHSQVIKAEWDEKKQIYHVHVRDLKTDEVRVDCANAIISAIGQLNVPNYSKGLEGVRSKFKGNHFHSARWDHTVDLRNKRVAVIGNGGSGCQFMPVLSQDPTTKIVNFCRSPGWFLPDLRVNLNSGIRWAMRNIPFVKTMARYSVFIQHEMIYFSFFVFGKSSLIKAPLALYIKSQTPKEYWDKIIPTHPSGCKRFIIDVGYLKALNQENFTVNYDGVAEVTETGIRTKAGQFMEFDVIIEATGFVADEYPIEVSGIGGKTIQEYYREQGGPTAYVGTTAPGFPNFFTLCGPNTITGHGSVVFTEENQMVYTNQLLEPVIKGLASSFVVTEKAANSYNERLQRTLRSSIWAGCTSWYRSGHDGKVTSVWPVFIWTQWLWLREPIWAHYIATGGEAWERRRQFSRMISFVKAVSLLIVALWVSLNWRLVHSTFANLSIGMH